MNQMTNKENNWAKRDFDRESDICSYYLAGKTLQEIGDMCLITGERVRQILKRNGITAKDSPRKEIKRIEKEHIKRLRQRKRFLELFKPIKSYGCLRIKIHEMRGKMRDVPGDPFALYRQQRHNTNHRGIAWEITFPEWWAVWEDSGKWDRRGRGIGQYVMGRINDLGPYSKDNVRIISHSQNIVDGHSRRMERKIKSGVANE